MVRRRLETLEHGPFRGDHELRDGLARSSAVTTRRGVPCDSAGPLHGQLSARRPPMAEPQPLLIVPFLLMLYILLDQVVNSG